MNQEKCPDQLDLFQTSVGPEPLRNRPDLILTYSKISESGRSYTDGTIIYYTKIPNRLTLLTNKCAIKNKAPQRFILTAFLINFIYFDLNLIGPTFQERGNNPTYPRSR